MSEVIKDAEHTAKIHQFITFSVNKQEYGIEITSIREIKGWINTTTLPNTPQYMRGVINLRGSVVPVLDLRCRFGMGITEASKAHVIMILNIQGRIMGLLVDTVSDIIYVNDEDIKSVPSMDISEGQDTVLQGIADIDGRMVALLSLEKIFDHTKNLHFEGEIHQEIMQEHHKKIEN
jgi:purine-binding chemotaxis protein CheW